MIESLTCPCGAPFSYEYRGSGPHRMHCDRCRTPSARTERYLKSHPEYRKKMGRQHYQKNKDRIKAQAAAWGKANRERKNELERIRTSRDINHTRALKRNRELVRRFRKISQFVEYVDCVVVFERDSGTCQICNEPIGDAVWHIDHIKPLVAGGEHSYANVQLTHGVCNLRKGARV